MSRSIKEIIEEARYFETQEISRDLPSKEIILSGDLFYRGKKRFATIYYLSSSDHIDIPCEYLNLFRVLNRREGYRLHDWVSSGDSLTKFIGLGVMLDKMLSGIDSRGIRDLLGKLVVIGTKELRKIYQDLSPWTLRNIYNTIEI